MSNTINKIIPNNIALRTDVIQNMMASAEDYVNDHVEAINRVNDSYLIYLDGIASYINKAAADISVNTNAVADLFVTSGKTNTSSSLLDNLKPFTNTDSQLDLNNYQVKIGNKSYSTTTIQSRYQPQDIKILPSIGSTQADFNLGNTKEFSVKKYYQLDNIVSATDRLEIEALNKQLSFVLLVDLGSNKLVNNISFNIFNVGGDLFPRIRSIQGAANGAAFKPTKAYGLDSLDINNLNLDPTKSVNNLTLDIDQFFIRFLRIEFVQINSYVPRNFAQIRRFAVGFNNLTVGFAQPKDNSTIVLGPVSTDSEILKASVSANLENYDVNEANVIFEITNDINNGSYYRVLNSKEVALNQDVAKVLNFNNIAFNSIKTTDPVKELFLKITLNALKKKISIADLLTLKELEKFIKRTRFSFTKQNAKLTLPGIDPESITIFKLLNERSGLVNHTLEITDVKSEYFDIKKDDKYVKTLTGLTDKIKASSSREKLTLLLDQGYSGLPLHDFDKYNVNVFSVSDQFTKSENIESKFSNGLYFWKPAKQFEVSLKPSLPEGKYILKYLDKAIEFNIYGHHTSVTYFNRQIDSSIPEATEFVLFNEIGVEIGKLTSKVSGDLRYVSLFDIMEFESSDIDGFEMNFQFPFTPIAENEWTMTSDGLVFSKNVLGRFDLQLVNVTEQEFSTAKLISGQDKIKLVSPKLIKTKYKLVGGAFESVYKLKHKAILESSVKFDIADASINTFLKEVPYQDGATEFTVAEVTTTKNNFGLNVIELHTGFVDSLENHIFFQEDSPVSLFQDQVYSRLELISQGQWLLEYNTGTSRWNVVLPDGISIPTDSDVAISYLINSEESVSSGLYSIDYRNGIIYTSSPIDDKISIEYIYINTYIEYEHMERLTDRVIETDEEGISIKDPTLLAEEADYLVIEQTAPEEEIEYSVSPKVNDLKLNIVTRNEVF